VTRTAQSGLLLTVIAYEMDLSTGKATGYEEEYLAGSMEDGSLSCLYTAKLKDGRAVRGSTGRVIYPHGLHGDRVLVLRRGDL
jgi:hypothetical protein